MRSQNCLSMVVSALLTNCTTHQVCKNIQMDESILNEWKSIILTMSKKGDITKCEDYGTISLINHSSKVLLEITRSQMKPYVETILAEERAGFRSGRSTVEQVFGLKLLIQHRIDKKDEKFFVIFIDYKTEFGMMVCLQYYNITVSLRNSSTSSEIPTARQAKSCIRLNNNFTEWFETTIRAG